MIAVVVTLHGPGTEGEPEPESKRRRQTPGRSGSTDRAGVRREWTPHPDTGTGGYAEAAVTGKNRSPAHGPLRRRQVDRDRRVRPHGQSVGRTLSGRPGGGRARTSATALFAFTLFPGAFQGHLTAGGKEKPDPYHRRRQGERDARCDFSSGINPAPRANGARETAAPAGLGGGCRAAAPGPVAGAGRGAVRPQGPLRGRGHRLGAGTCRIPCRGVRRVRSDRVPPPPPGAHRPLPGHVAVGRAHPDHPGGADLFARGGSCRPDAPATPGCDVRGGRVVPAAVRGGLRPVSMPPRGIRDRNAALFADL